MRSAKFWLIAVISLLAGCGGISSPKFFPQLKGVVIDSTTPTGFDQIGQVRQYRLMGLYSTPPGSASDTTSEAIADASWELSEPTVASLGVQGAVAALHNGDSELRGSYGGFTSPSVVLTVASPVLKTITVTPATDSVPLGLTRALTAVGSYLLADGSTATRNISETLQWQSSAPQIAGVTAQGNGALVNTLQQSATPVTITASATSAEGQLVTGEASITVAAPELLRVLIERSDNGAVSPFGVAKGAAINLRAKGVYTDSAAARDIPGAVSWATADQAATVLSLTPQPNGSVNVKGLNVGTSTVTASAAKSDGSSVSSDASTVNVGNAVLNSLDGATILPNPARVAVGASLQLTVMGVYSDGSIAAVPASQLNWTVSNGNASVGVDGVALGVTQGAAVVTATLKTLPASGAAAVSTTLIVTDGVCLDPLLQTQGATVSSYALPVLCLACTVTDELLAIDNDPKTYASLNNNLGLLGGYTELKVTSPAPVTPAAGQRAGFIISRPPGELLSLALLGAVTVETLDASDAVVESAVTFDGLRLTLIGAYIIGQDAYVLSMPVTKPYQKLRVQMNSGVATVAQSLQVNSACAATGQ